MPVSDKQKFYFAGIIALMAAIIALGAWEISLRCAAKERPVMNSWGFHDPEPDLRGADRLRVLVAGDSFVEGIAVKIDRTVGQQIERILADRFDAEVVSLGEPGAGQGGELELLERYLPVVQPKVVVLMVFPGNDVWNNSAKLDIKANKSFYRLAQGRLVRLPSPPTQAGSSPGRVRVIGEIRRRIDIWRAKRAMIKAGHGIPGPFLVYNKTVSPDWREAWEITFALTERIQRIVTESGATLLVVAIPERFQVSPDAFDRLLAEYPAMRNIQWDLSTPVRQFGEWCARSNVPFLDLTHDFRARYSDRLFIPDGHWSADGHRLAAEAIAEKLHSHLVFAEPSADS